MPTRCHWANGSSAFAHILIEVASHVVAYDHCGDPMKTLLMSTTFKCPFVGLPHLATCAVALPLYSTWGPLFMSTNFSCLFVGLPHLPACAGCFASDRVGLACAVSAKTYPVQTCVDLCQDSVTQSTVGRPGLGGHRAGNRRQRFNQTWPGRDTAQFVRTSRPIMGPFRDQSWRHPRGWQSPLWTSIVCNLG